MTMEIGRLQEKLRLARGRRRAPETPNRLALGSDHAGFRVKANLKRHLEALGYEVVDVGTTGPGPVDYPDFAVSVAREVASGACWAGIIIDGAGMGSCIAANKIRGIRAVTCHDETTARQSREHLNANVLALGSGVVHPGHARRLVRLWLDASFAGGRHQRRVAKLDALDGER